MIERPSTASTMADAGAFALHSMAHGLPLSRSNSGNASPYGGGGSNTSNTSSGGGPALLATPRSLPGPASVLGSSRVPASSSSPLFSRPSTYPSPLTTPVIHGASPAWSGGGYEASPYTTMATPVPSSLAAQSLERLPDLYSATPPPTSQPQPVSAAESAGDVLHQAGGMVGGSQPLPSHQHQYGYGYVETAVNGHSDLKREPGQDEAGADGINNSTVSGRY